MATILLRVISAYPLNKSNVEKYFEPHNASTVSSILAYYQSSILPRSTQTLINWCASSRINEMFDINSQPKENWLIEVPLLLHWIKLDEIKLAAAPSEWFPTFDVVVDG
ncbi:hypothetical protein OUZ56_001793 [Daphnia magna]|uniref:Uncharacterized protein n=1 Tax=Daphnia magna TaxID=35525 RepID=A0ABR0A3R9_9CRUS|nr:hypothetical protein OUZ56_001793 [Daphnia magna]